MRAEGTTCAEVLGIYHVPGKENEGSLRALTGGENLPIKEYFTRRFAREQFHNNI